MDTNLFSFSVAIECLKDGSKLSRQGWNGKGLFISLQVPDAHSKMTRPYIYITTPAGSTYQFMGERVGETNSSEQRVPWLCSQTDLMAEDWYVVKDEPSEEVA